MESGETTLAGCAGLYPDGGWSVNAEGRQIVMQKQSLENMV
jgi:hypothetical protein